MTKLVCTGCNYRFESENIIDCPYCGREHTVEKEPSAKELLEEIEGLLAR